MLEITERAVGLTMIAERRASRCDGFRQHVTDGLHQSFRGFRGSAACLDRLARRPVRRQAGAVQRLAYVYIAQPRDQLLVKKGRLQGRFLVAEKERQDLGVKGVR